MPDTNMKNTPFHFDFTVNLPLLAVVVSGIIAGTAWTSTMNNRMTAVEVATAGLPDVREKIARIDERGDNSKAALARIEQRLDRLDP